MALTLPLPSQNMPAEVYSYLFQMAQLLNLAMDNISAGTVVQASGGNTTPSQSTSSEDNDSYNQLRSLIIKTADAVHHEMDQLTTKLSEEYIATSEFGTYTQELNAYIEANPEALTQYYSFASALQADVDAVDSAFSKYKADTEGYIRTGIVYEDENGLPVYGVAVGQNLTATEVDGQQVVDKNNFRAVFTANRLSFWQDSVEVAYMSNNKLYITNSTVLENLQIGEWSVSSTNGLAFKYIGG